MKNNIDIILSNNIFEVFEKKIESEDLSEDQEDVILTFLEEFMKKTMRFKIHTKIKGLLRESKLIEFLKPLALLKGQTENGTKAYDIIARYYKDIKEEIIAKLEIEN